MLQNNAHADGASPLGDDVHPLEGTRPFDGADLLGGVDPLGGARPLAGSARIAELEREVAQLREALEHRRQYGLVTGVLAARFGMSPERAWALLVRLSQPSNQKMRVVTRVVHDAYFDRLRPEDRALATKLDDLLRGQLSVPQADQQAV